MTTDADAMTGTAPCWCESLVCEADHEAGHCAASVPAGANGTPERPWMVFLGPICVPCAVRIGRTASAYVTAPYGTLTLA